MAKEREYQELYDRLIHEVSTLHQTNRRRIRNGMRMLVAVTLGGGIMGIAGMLLFIPFAAVIYQLLARDSERRNALRKAAGHG